MRIAVTDPQPLPSGRAPERPLFAIGDVHGHSDALGALLDHIAREIADRHAHAAVDVVILGDLVDRGPDPLGCLRRAIEGARAANAVTRTLLGNHDWYLAAAAELRGLTLSGQDLEAWLAWGGRETLEAMSIEPWDLRAVDVRDALGSARCALLEEAPLYIETGRILCVHAGVDPEAPMAAQTDDNLMWIRDQFLIPAEFAAHPWPLDRTVVHGHTPDAWGIHPHRIGVDSGGHFTGTFMAAELDAEAVRLHAAQRDDARA